VNLCVSVPLWFCCGLKFTQAKENHRGTETQRFTEKNRRIRGSIFCWSNYEMHSNIKLLFQIGERSPSRNSTGRSSEIAALQFAIVNRQSQIVDVSC
jgi:hypothetical protein